MTSPRNVSDILNKLTHVKTAGKEKWIASCPCAGHKTPGKHLSIENVDGKALIKCFGTHTYEDVCQALGYDSVT